MTGLIKLPVSSEKLHIDLLAYFDSSGAKKTLFGANRKHLFYKYASSKRKKWNKECLECELI